MKRDPNFVHHRKITRDLDGSCITEAAIRHGATKEEIAEALGVATSVNAGATLVYSARVMDAFREYPRAASPNEPDSPPIRVGELGCSANRIARESLFRPLASSTIAPGVASPRIQGPRIEDGASCHRSPQRWHRRSLLTRRANLAPPSGRARGRWGRRHGEQSPRRQARGQEAAALVTHDTRLHRHAPRVPPQLDGDRAARRPRPIRERLLPWLDRKLSPTCPALFAARMTSPTKVCGRLAPRLPWLIRPDRTRTSSPRIVMAQICVWICLLHSSLSAAVPQRAGQTIGFLLSGFIALKTTSPLPAKTCDKLRSRRFISHSGRAVRIKGNCWISGESRSTDWLSDICRYRAKRLWKSKSRTWRNW
jgi:hypothetical protein